MAKTSDSQMKAVARYNKANVYQVNLQLNRKTDADIIEWLDKQPNKNGAIKEALRKEMS